MAYVTVSSAQQLFGMDPNNPNVVTINTTPANLQITVQSLRDSLTVAESMAKALGVDVSSSASSSSTTSSGNSGATTSGSSASSSTASSSSQPSTTSGATVTSGGTTTA